MLYIIRHGRTDLNKARVLQGRSDWPLNEEGMQQAMVAAERLAGVTFSRVFSSPLMRAVQTARLVAPGVNPVTDERLVEMDYGPYEGTSLESPSPEVVRFFADFEHQPAPAGMEPLDQVVARMGEFIESIRGLSGDILVATHAIAMKGALEYLTPGSNGSYWSKHIANCAVYVANNEGGELGVPHELA